MVSVVLAAKADAMHCMESNTTEIELITQRNETAWRVIED